MKCLQPRPGSHKHGGECCISLVLVLNLFKEIPFSSLNLRTQPQMPFLCAGCLCSTECNFQMDVQLNLSHTEATFAHKFKWDVQV
jgi:hypothetical protein